MGNPAWKIYSLCESPENCKSVDELVFVFTLMMRWRMHCCDVQCNNLNCFSTFAPLSIAVQCSKVDFVLIVTQRIEGTKKNCSICDSKGKKEDFVKCNYQCYYFVSSAFSEHWLYQCVCEIKLLKSYSVVIFFFLWCGHYSEDNYCVLGYSEQQKYREQSCKK